MLRVFLVIQAEVIEQVGVDGEELRELDGPRLRVGFGIVDGEVDVETAVVHTMEHKGTKSQKSKGKGQKSKVSRWAAAPPFFIGNDTVGSGDAGSRVVQLLRGDGKASHDGASIHKGAKSQKSKVKSQK